MNSELGYIVDVDLTTQSGVTKKILEQVDAWRRAGVDVEVFSSGPSGPGSVRWLRRLDALCERAGRRGLSRYYVRFSTWTPSLERLTHVSAVILELNGDDVIEASTRRRAFRVYHRTTRARALTGASGIVVPTYELAARTTVNSYGTPVFVAPNGIDLSKHAQSKPPGNTRPLLGFAYTSPGPWTGIRDVLRLAAETPEFDYVIIGPVPDGRLPPNATACGFLEGARYMELAARIDVGISSLNLHRAGLTEASTLKIRGYLACGVPAILGHIDSDFPNGADFLLRVPNREGGVLERIPEIRTFVRSWFGRRVPRSSILKLDLQAKERSRLRFIDQVSR